MNCRIVFRFKLSALRSLRIRVILIEPLTTVGKMVGKLVENAVELQYVKNNSFFRSFFSLNLGWGGMGPIRYP